jgi:hypothetical protein
MKRLNVACMLLALLLFPPCSLEAGELFLCKNAFIHEREGNTKTGSSFETRQVEELKKKACSIFRPGDRIIAVYLFKHKGTEEVIEFRWKRQFGRNARIEEKNYLHRIESKFPAERYLCFAWMQVQPTLLDRVLGSRYAGDWLVEVHVGHKQVSEAQFTILHD